MKSQGVGPVAYFANRGRQHARWALTQGVGRLIEEDQLNPVSRASLALRKRRWRRANAVTPSTAIPVWLVGVQRSGTNMLVHGLERSPEFEVRNENDRRAFYRFRLRPDEVLQRLVAESPHRYILFKPLCDSHRVLDLVDHLGGGAPGRAIWAYRSVDGRARSAVCKFGRSNLDALRDVAEGRGEGRWQAERLSEDSLQLIKSFDYDRLSPESAAALFWYVRNRLYFEMRLHERPDVTIASYDRLVADPEGSMRALCDFLRFPYHPRLSAHVASRAGDVSPLQLDSRIRLRCDELQQCLDRAAQEKHNEHSTE
jgi:hypothetical protein